MAQLRPVSADLKGMRRSRFARGFLAALLMAAATLVLLLPVAAQAEGHAQVFGAQVVRTTVEDFLVPSLPRPVRVHVLPCPGDPAAQGCHSSGRSMDTIWVNPEAGGLDSETVAHEMGHVFESYMWDLRWHHVAGSAFVPRTFRRIAASLFDDPGQGILLSSAWSERFAESYSACARIPALTETLRTGYWGFEMTPEDHARICPLIDQMARHYEEATAADPSILNSVVLSQAPSP